MYERQKRDEIDFSSFPNIIKAMTENNELAAHVIDNLIEQKSETEALTALIILDDINIRGHQLYNLYKLAGENTEKFYQKAINLKEDDILKINKLSASLCPHKAIFKGTKKDRIKHPEKYMFTLTERESYITPKKDLYPTVKIEEALNILNEKGFNCGYKKEYINKNNEREIYRIFYDKYGNIAHTFSLEDKDVFLWKDAKLNITCQNENKQINYILNLKDHPFKTYEEILKNSNIIPSLQVIKTEKSIKFVENNPSYSSCISAYIYDLLSFETTYQNLDNNLKTLYKPLLDSSINIAYDELINFLNQKEGLLIATALQNMLGHKLDEAKLIEAQDRLYEKRNHQNKFISSLLYYKTKQQDISKKIKEILNQEIK